MAPATKLVIFDCDGVLVDSEPISIAVLLETVAEAGLVIDERVAYQRFLGRSMATIAIILEQEFGLRMTADHLGNIRARLYERFRRELKPVAGIAAAISRLQSPFCVASSSQVERIRLSLAIAGLLESFEPHIYSASMVENGKPAPDLFLHVAQSMGAAPAECVVVEDSPAGIEAAQRAGMRVFAFVGASHAGPGGLLASTAALAPDATFNDMHQLPALLAQIGETARAG